MLLERLTYDVTDFERVVDFMNTVRSSLVLTVLSAW